MTLAPLSIVALDGEKDSLIAKDGMEAWNQSVVELGDDCVSRAVRDRRLLTVACLQQNTLPGDATAANSSGMRVATPWLTQRGVTHDQLKELAAIIA